MKSKPNAFQRLIHQVVMLRLVTAFLADKMYIIDKLVLNLTKGKYTISEFAGWTIIQLTTTGAKTGQMRTSPLIGLTDRDKIAIIGSSFGRAHNPGWYYNLKANPHCYVSFKGESREYISHEAEGEERERYFRMAVSQYAGYEKYKERAVHRRIPVMVLEPKK